MATISADYALAALKGRDLVQIPQRLRAKGDEPSLALLSLTEEGMSLISNSSLHLDEANSQTVVSAAERLANIYTTAYGVSPAIDPATMDANQFKDMRTFVRRWVENGTFIGPIPMPFSIPSSRRSSPHMKRTSISNPKAETTFNRFAKRLAPAVR